MELNLKQKKILKLLAINCRFSNKDIAKSVGVSEDTVKYQIDNLINNKKFGFFNTQFVHTNLGYTSYHHWIRVGSKISLERLKKIPHINSINSCYGKFNYQVLSYAKNKKQIKETIKEIKKLKPLEYEYAEFIEQYKRHTNVISSISVSVKIPINKKKFEYALRDEMYALPKSVRSFLDDVDKKIISVLLKNPRASFQEISHKTKINHETIRYRIKKYLNEGLINNFGLIHDYKKYGLFNAFVLFKSKSIDESRFIEYLKNQKNVYFSPKLLGSYNGLVYILAKNPKELGIIYDEVIEHLGVSVEKVDLLFWGDVLLYTQFPEGELD